MGERFRVKKGFTVVQNSVARDLTVSEKALGLYVRIQSWITLPGAVTKTFLMNKCNSGEKAFDAAWKELQRLGYLKTYQYRQPNSVTFDTEHELLESSEPDTPYFYIISKPSNLITSFWSYNASGKAENHGGLRVPMQGSRMEKEDRESVGGVRSSPPQNRGDCSHGLRIHPPCDGEDQINTDSNSFDHASGKNDIREERSGDGLSAPASLPGLNREQTEAVERFTRTLYRRYASGEPTEADRESVCRCVTQSGEAGTELDSDKMELLEYAFDQARMAGKPGNWNYVGGVLGRLSQRGIRSRIDAELFDLDR